MEQTKVYCRNCKFLAKDGLNCRNETMWKCTAPSNQAVSENWYESVVRPIQAPDVINKDNNCRHYEEKQL